MFSLLDSQNPDGGWPHYPGKPSWTEPTAYALLALQACSSRAAPVQRALAWLREAQLPDGGWTPQPGIAQSTWVTAVVALLGPAPLGGPVYGRAIRWLVDQSGAESGLWNRLRLFLSGASPPEDPRLRGWPWYPGTHAWVAPTALSVLALGKALRRQPSAEIRARRDLGVAYLLGHACSDGGWNYGAARALGHDAQSYPETTGLALLALHGTDAPAVRKGCAYARAHLKDCHSAEAESWIRLGLLAQGQLPSGAPPPTRPMRGIQHAALALLASAAEHGRNLFLEEC